MSSQSEKAETSENGQIRVRFPPSPTGDLHIGSARTALFNWLFCRQRGGKLVLRIEDTDVERSTEASSRGIVDGLQWMGIDWDEGPYLQTSFAEDHRAAAEELIVRGDAYRCYCTAESLKAKREAAQEAKQTYQYDRTCLGLSDDERAQREAAQTPSVVRFRVPARGPNGESKVMFDDIVYGPNEIALADIEDFIIVRSTGVPLYILSNVVDDHRDRITHVIRGQDHLTNTPKQILLYQALGWEVPRFAHMPLTLDPQKAKISKRRHGDVVAVRFYQEHGFIPWAFCNFMALLGWSGGDDRELYLERSDLIEAFSLEGISRSNAVFNYNPKDSGAKFITDPKAVHINTQHLRGIAPAALAPHVEQALADAQIMREEWAAGGVERDWFLATIDLLRVRFHYVTDFSTVGRAYFSDEFEIDEKARQKSLGKDPRLREYLPRLADKLATVEPFDVESTEAPLRELADELGVKAGLLINAARVVLTGQGRGPGIFDLFAALGRDRVVERLRRGVELVPAS